MPALANQFQQMAGVLTADEMTLRPLRLERVSESQAAHDMAATHLQRGVGAKGDLHLNS
jgi:hypothetical protein